MPRKLAAPVHPSSLADPVARHEAGEARRARALEVFGGCCSMVRVAQQ